MVTGTPFSNISIVPRSLDLQQHRHRYRRIMSRRLNYTLEKSVADGVNVPPRVFRIKTKITEQGGAIKSGEEIQRVSNLTNRAQTKKLSEEKEYGKEELDRSIVVPSQIETVVRVYKDAIYTTLYPERKREWNMVPKTLFFAKNERHADNILEAVKKVFASEFPNGTVPDGFVQKITCTQNDTNSLIREFRNSKDFRIAITVTLVATGTDVKPLEILVFMRDVESPVLYTQMKGRGCRTINDDVLRNVTSNAVSKDFYYLIDAVGVTEHEKSMPSIAYDRGKVRRVLSLKDLMEHLAHGEVSDENLNLFMGYLSNISKKADNDDILDLNDLLDPKTLREIIINLSSALGGDGKVLPEYTDINEPNTERKLLVSDIVDDVKARTKLLEINAGFLTKAYAESDEVVYSGFSKEQSKEYVELFEGYITKNKDEIEALRILHDSRNTVITYSMLKELEKKLLAFNNNLKADFLWGCYETLDGEEGRVKPLKGESERECLTNLIQLVRYGYKHIAELVSLKRKFGSYFELYCGQKQKGFTKNEIETIRQIAEYIVQNGCFDGKEKLYDYKRDLFFRAIGIFTKDRLDAELHTISEYIFYGKAA